MTHDPRLEQIRERLEKATPGPWAHIGIPYDGVDDPCIFSTAVKDRYGEDQYVAQTTYDMQSGTIRESIEADTELIAHAPDDLRYLLERVESLERDHQDAQRWRAVRTRFPLHGHPILTPESADAQADALLGLGGTGEARWRIPGGTPMSDLMRTSECNIVVDWDCKGATRFRCYRCGLPSM